MRPIELITRILEFNRGYRGSKLTPCLVGPTGAGKTSLVEELGRKAGKKVVRLLAQTSMPEDILGIPRVDPTSGSTRFFVSELLVQAQDPGRILFLDEIDKPREEVLASLLTLLSDRQVHGLDLGADIVCAMQPVDPEVWTASETGKALAARLVFVPLDYSQGYRYIEDKFGISIPELIKSSGMEIRLPLLGQPSPRQLEWFCSFWEQDPEAAEEAASGIFVPEVASYLINKLRSRSEAPVSEIVARLFSRAQEDPEVWDRLGLGEMIKILVQASTIVGAWPWTKALDAFLKRASRDERQALLSDLATHLVAEAKARGGEVDFLPGSGPEEVATIIFKIVGHAVSIEGQHQIPQQVLDLIREFSSR